MFILGVAERTEERKKQMREINMLLDSAPMRLNEPKLGGEHYLLTPRSQLSVSDSVM